jgi:hypothetical protein
MPLDSLLDELWHAGVPASAASVLLRVFERYPDGEDGGGVFWSIVHGLERVGGYESTLLHSVRSSPSEFGVVMVGRLLNAGVSRIDDSDLKEVLSTVSNGSGVPSRVAKVASRFLKRKQE